MGSRCSASHCPDFGACRWPRPLRGRCRSEAFADQSDFACLTRTSVCSARYPRPMGLTLRPEAFRAWVTLCVEGLVAARAEIDALNVFPVPDSDTGTNAYLTFVAGADAVESAGDVDLPVLVKAYTDGLLLGAKGNCGVIMSQLVRACFGSLDVADELTASDVARSFRAASDAAYAAVGRPVEGTILSVSAAAASGAETAATDGTDGRVAFARAGRAAREALARTPMQMERLARAGVVDAGGRA